MYDLEGFLEEIFFGQFEPDFFSEMQLCLWIYISLRDQF